jgi:3-oxoacyl-[acyl-carrier protein] reductase
MTGTLNGKTALVTGASRGLGAATARRLARDGAFVLVHYGKARAEAEAVLAAITAAGGRGALLQADLAVQADVERLAVETKAALRAHVGTDRLDILVNNAGVAPFSSLTEMDPGAFDQLFAINVRAPFFLTARLVDVIPAGGAVIMLSSAVAKKAFPGIPAYSATKGAIDTLVIHLAADLGAKGIRVAAVAPGAIETDMSAWLGSDEGKAQAHAIQALQRVGQPEDIANAVAFAAGPDGAWVTGSVVYADGGTKL